MAKKVLIAGGQGLLGAYLQREFGQNAVCLGRDQLDIGDFEKLRTIVSSSDIEWVINCAGSARGDALSLFQLNAYYPLQMAKVCAELGVGYVFMSSARVFGEGAGPFDEDDMPAPVDDYGMSKFAGERFVQRELADGKYYVFRVSMTLGGLPVPKDGQLISRLIEKGALGENVRAATDAETSVVHGAAVARSVFDCVESGLPSGVYHLASSDHISIYELASNVFGLLKVPNDVQPALSQEFGACKIPSPKVQGLVSRKLPACGTCLSAIEAFCSEYVARYEQ